MNMTRALSLTSLTVASLFTTAAFTQGLPATSPDACKKDNQAKIAATKSDFDALKLADAARAGLLQRLAALSTENGALTDAAACPGVLLKLNTLKRDANDVGAKQPAAPITQPGSPSPQPHQPASAFSDADLKACTDKLPSLEKDLVAAKQGKNFGGDQQWMQREGAIKAARLGLGKNMLQKCKATESALESAIRYANNKK